MECVVCITETKQFVKCMDPFCTCVCCWDCLKEYLGHTAKQSTLPVCVGKGCGAIYSLQTIIQFGPMAAQNYIDSCCNALVMKNRSQIEEELKGKQILEAMKKEKTKYLHETFPKAVALVAEITCKQKLNRINHHQVDNKKYGRICMNLFCGGILNEELVFAVCSSKFCKSCEKLLTPEHKCNPDDVESLKATQEYPKCPKCGLPNDKDQACDNVMCGVCGTKYVYNTKQLGGSGGHTQMVEVKTRITLSSQYKDVLSKEMLECLILIENKPLKPASFDPVITAVKNHLLGKQVDKMKMVLALDEYNQAKYAWKKFMRFLAEIEKMIQTKTLTLQTLHWVYYNV